MWVWVCDWDSTMRKVLVVEEALLCAVCGGVATCLGMWWIQDGNLKEYRQLVNGAM